MVEVEGGADSVTTSEIVGIGLGVEIDMGISNVAVVLDVVAGDRIVEGGVVSEVVVTGVDEVILMKGLKVEDDDVGAWRSVNSEGKM